MNSKQRRRKGRQALSVLYKFQGLMNITIEHWETMTPAEIIADFKKMGREVNELVAEIEHEKASQHPAQQHEGEVK